MKPIPETNNTGNNFPQNLTDDGGSGAFDSDPTWSPYLPDGSTRVAFHRNGDVWIVDPDNVALKDPDHNRAGRIRLVPELVAERCEDRLSEQPEHGGLPEHRGRPGDLHDKGAAQKCHHQ
jgi:hypothetical protein